MGSLHFEFPFNSFLKVCSPSLLFLITPFHSGVDGLCSYVTVGDLMAVTLAPWLD